MTFQFLLCCQTERCKTKKNRCNFSTAAMSSSHLWFRLISWCDGVQCRYFITAGFIIFTAQPSRGKSVIGRLKWSQLALLLSHSGCRIDIWVYNNTLSSLWPLLFSSRPWVIIEQTVFAKFTTFHFILLHTNVLCHESISLLEKKRIQALCIFLLFNI